MVYPPIQYTPTPKDQQQQLQKIYQQALAKGIPRNKIFQAFQQYGQNVIKSKSQKASNMFTNPINNQGNPNPLAGPGTFGPSGTGINESEFGTPFVNTNPTAPTQFSPIAPAATPEVPTYDTTDINADAMADINNLQSQYESNVANIMKQRTQTLGQYGIQENALLNNFENGELISKRVDTINNLLAEGKTEDEIASQLGFTKDQLYKYAKGDYFDAVLKPEAQSKITENYDLQLQRNEEDANIAKQRIKTNLDQLNTDYQTEQSRLQQEIATQNENMSKLLGINGAGFSSSGLKGLEMINQQNMNLLQDMTTQHTRNTDQINNQMQDLGITLVRATEDINKQAREAIQTGANAAMAAVQKIKTEIGTTNVDAIVKIQEVEAKFAELIQARRDQQVQETTDLNQAIKDQYQAIKDNQAELDKQQVAALENVKTYGANMTLQDIINKGKTGELTPEYAKLAVSQLIQSTIKSLDDASGGLFGTQNAEQIKKLLGQGKTPNAIIQQFAGQFQQQTEAPEVKNFGTAKRPNYKQWNGTERVPVPGGGGFGGGGGGGGGGGFGGDGSSEVTGSSLDIINQGVPGKQTADKLKIKGFADRMNQSANDIIQYEKKYAALSGFGQKIQEYTPELLKSQDQKNLELLKKNFITATLRPESGAAISESEFANEEKKYFPQPGDSVSTIKNKQKARELAIRNMYAGAGFGNKYKIRNVDSLRTGTPTNNTQTPTVGGTVTDIYNSLFGG